MAHHPTSSRVLDALLDSPTVPYKAKRKFVMAFIGHYHVLVDDRIGSRVGDRCWAAADPYLREKIARSLAPHEHALAGSFYGKFFARNLALHVLRRDPERWKSMQAAAKQSQPSVVSPTAQAQAPAKALAQKQNNGGATAGDDVPSASVPMEKGKKKAQPQDEIDALFESTLGKAVKKADLAGPGEHKTKDQEDGASKSKSKDKDKLKDRGGADKGEKKGKKRKEREEGGADKDLSDVLGAIRSAPKEDKGPKKKKRAH